VKVLLGSKAGSVAVSASIALPLAYADFIMS